MHLHPNLIDSRVFFAPRGKLISNLHRNRELKQHQWRVTAEVPLDRGTAQLHVIEKSMSQHGHHVFFEARRSFQEEEGALMMSA